MSGKVGARVGTSKKTKYRLPNLRLGFPGNILLLLREVGIIILLAVAGYLYICLATYSPTDPGPSQPYSPGVIENKGGVVGAWIADLLFVLFGSSAYLFLLFLCVTAWRVYRERRTGIESEWDYFLPILGCLLAMVGACALEQVYFPGSPADVFPAGGVIGQYIGTGFVAGFGLVGASLILLGLVITGVTLVGHVSWFRLMDRIGYALFMLAGLIWRRMEGFVDGMIGSRVRKSRQASVNRLRSTMAQRKRPRIAPKVDFPEQGRRIAQEKQMNLFPPDSGGAALPELSLLDSPVEESRGYSKTALESISSLLVKKLKDFNVDVTVEAIQPGPIITRFEIEPAPGTKASQIVGLSRDLARSLSVVSVRVVENIPGKSVIGIEIPNQNREIVRLVDGLSSREYENNPSPLTIVLGKDIAGNPVISDLVKMPHVLIAGTTGSGKSVCVNALILSLIYKSTPETVRLIMVDPKFLELSVYDGIPHLLTPVVTDMNKAAHALRWCIIEMDRRFRLMASVAVRNISGFNKKVENAAKSGQPLTVPDVDAQAENEPEILAPLPYIVVIVDELADLMMVAGKKIEEIIIRIAQRARAAGIHLVLATQRPSVDVVTGLIKANVPTRIAFQVSSRADSRTVLDQMGAEQLLGQGDMLFLPPGSGFLQRVHGSFVSDSEVNQVVSKLKEMGEPVYLDEITSGDVEMVGEAGDTMTMEGEGEEDPLYDEAVSFVTKSRKGSISAVQRALRVGYNRAARMIESMEQSGVVSPPDNGKREVLAPMPPED